MAPTRGPNKGQICPSFGPRIGSSDSRQKSILISKKKKIISKWNILYFGSQRMKTKSCCANVCVIFYLFFLSFFSSSYFFILILIFIFYFFDLYYYFHFYLYLYFRVCNLGVGYLFYLSVYCISFIVFFFVLVYLCPYFLLRFQSSKLFYFGFIFFYIGLIFFRKSVKNNLDSAHALQSASFYIIILHT